ncbi:MAG: lytic murein transglycosylase [Pseudomonadota bacterium]
MHAALHRRAVIFILTVVTVLTPSPASATDVGDEFQNWRSSFIDRSSEHGVPRAFAAQILNAVTPNPHVLSRARRQPELRSSLAGYLEQRVTAERQRKGRELLDQHAALLAELQKQHGVPGEVLVAIWGLESSYGENLGVFPVIEALATLAHGMPRRRTFWERQLFAALRLLERERRPWHDLRGSWAGAIGHTQFIPTTREAFAIDGDGDGRIDLRRSPADALASTARYLSASGWQATGPRDEPVALEVLVPNAFSYAMSGRRQRHPRDTWQAAGVVPVTGGDLTTRIALPSASGYALIVPQGHRGPHFLVNRNYAALLRYNNAQAYAFSVIELAAAIARTASVARQAHPGGPHRARPWKNTRPLSRADRARVQERLVARGYDTGGIDGILGDRSVAAIRAEQAKRALRADGFADARVLSWLAHSGRPHIGLE